MFMRGVTRRRTGRTKLTLAAAAATLALLALAAPAMAGLRNDVQKFSHCPLLTFGIAKCVYGVTTSGEFKLGESSTPITVPVVIQGGINGSGELVAPEDGTPLLSHSPQPVPGGLSGLGVGGPDNEVFATAELAGPASITSDVHLLLKTKLENPTLGNECYIGTDAEPLNLHLTYGPVNVSFKDHAITVLEGTLEDHTFAAPAATGCTANPTVGDALINQKEGLPSPSGKNAAIQTGTTEQVSRRLVREVLPLPAFGRCQKLSTKTGGYTNTGCTGSSVFSEGSFEWNEAPLASKTFTGTTAAATLETLGAGMTVKCTGGKTAGEYTGPKTETETITLTGCSSGPRGHTTSCQSSGAASGEIVSASLSGAIDFIKENEEGVKPEIGVDLKPASGTNLLAFECGGATTTVTGSVIAPIAGVDVMSTLFKVTAKQTGGKQAVEAFEEAPKDTLTFHPSGGEVPGALGMTETRTNSEKLEVKGEA